MTCDKRSSVPRARLLSLLLCAVVAGSACSKTEPTEEKPSRDFYNPALDIHLVNLDAQWTDPVNSTTETEVSLASTERGGTVQISQGPEENGVNLVAAVENHRQSILSRTDGAYSGAQELAGPMGAAFYSRGRFTSEDQMMEETAIAALHPRSSRVLWLTYVYPAGDDSSERVTELIELFSSVE